MRKAVAVIILIALLSVIITGCRGDDDPPAQPVSGENVSDTNAFDEDRDLEQEAIEAGWAGTYAVEFEDEEDMSSQVLTIADQGDRLLISLEVAFTNGSTGSLRDIIVMKSPPPDEFVAIFNNGEGFYLWFMLSPGSVKVTTSLSDPELDNPYCTPGAKFDGVYIRQNG